MSKGTRGTFLFSLIVLDFPLGCFRAVARRRGLDRSVKKSAKGRRKGDFSMRRVVAVAVGFLAVSALAQPAPKTEDEKTIYALGTFVGTGIKPFNLNKNE